MAEARKLLAERNELGRHDLREFAPEHLHVPEVGCLRFLRT